MTLWPDDAHVVIREPDDGESAPLCSVHPNRPREAVAVVELASQRSCLCGPCLLALIVEARKFQSRNKGRGGL